MVRTFSIRRENLVYFALGLKAALGAGLLTLAMHWFFSAAHGQSMAWNLPLHGVQEYLSGYLLIAYILLPHTLLSVSLGLVLWLRPVYLRYMTEAAFFALILLPLLCLIAFGPADRHPLIWRALPGVQILTAVALTLVSSRRAGVI